MKCAVIIYLFIKGMSCNDIYEDTLVPSYNVVKNCLAVSSFT